MISCAYLFLWYVFTGLNQTLLDVFNKLSPQNVCLYNTVSATVVFTGTANNINAIFIDSFMHLAYI